MLRVKPLLQLSGVTEKNLGQTAEQLLQALPKNCRVVCFEGEMGAGKTTLIRHLCAALHVEDNVSSPTYALVNEYQGENNLRICHFDFYRIHNQQEAADIGTEEYFVSGALCLVEWPSQVPDLLPELYAHINIEVPGPESRNIRLTLHEQQNDT